MIEQGIYKRLHDDAGIAALVGTRIEWEESAQSSGLPRLVIDISTEFDRCLLGTSSGLADAQMDIDCIASTYSGVRTLADLVRARLDRFHGTITDVPNSIDETINWIGVEHIDMDYDRPRDGGGKGTYTARLECRIWYGVTIPTLT